MIEPSTPDQIRILLARLALHCPCRDLTPDQFKLLIEDYIEDLQEFPRTSIALACKSYRSDPANVFFPSSGVLAALANRNIAPVTRRISAIEKILSADPEPAAERGEVDLSGLIRDPEPEPAPKEPLPLSLMVSVWKGQGLPDDEIEKLSKKHTEAA